MIRWLATGLILSNISYLYAQTAVDTSFTEDVLVTEIFLQSALKVSAISYRGSYQALGLFSSESPGFPIPKGIILSTGKASDAVEPNRSRSQSAILYRDGEKILDGLSGRETHDAAVLEFTFFPTHNTIAFDYLFASEEYPEYVNKGFNDVFAFILSDLHTEESRNLAIVPGTDLPVHIDNINEVNNPEWFIPNDQRQHPYYSALEYDGLTKMLSVEARVVPDRPYRIKLAIADVDDGKLDSGVILRANSFRSFDQPIDTPRATPVMVYFPLDSSELSESVREELRNFARRVLAASPSAIRVIGHTDALGSNEYNQQLSQRRVQSVVDFLGTQGLRGKVKLYRQSQGETQPVASNQAKDGRALNRRVEVQVVP
jgi:outer membrane protein OmpA-like peptidoglycan-associated protein